MQYKGKPIEDMNVTECLDAIADVSERLKQATGDEKYERICRFAFGTSFGIKKGLNHDSAALVGLGLVNDMTDGENDVVKS